MNRPLTVWLLAGLAAAAPGCVEPDASLKPVRVTHVDEVTLFALPAALNWDNRPGPDGVQIIVHLYRHPPAAPVLATGALEFLLFEGPIPRDKLPTAKPFHVWPFTASQLEPYVGRSMAGWGYALRLPWGSNVPTSASITLAARYIPSAGPPLYSAPTTIAMKPR